MSWKEVNNFDTKTTKIEKLSVVKKRRQPGVEFPSAKYQEHLLMLRFNISQSIVENDKYETVRKGLKQLCSLFDRIDKGIIKIDHELLNGDIKQLKLSEFNFSATLGFGKGFFEKLRISPKKTPKKLKVMPDHVELGDSKPYTLLQTDFIIQLCSNDEKVNRWIFRHLTSKPKIASALDNKIRISSYLMKKNPEKNDDYASEEIYSIISKWAVITDMHEGFQRSDGRNLLGFMDGISNPTRLSNDIVWTTLADEEQNLIDGTYMVFQKIEHDLDKWTILNDAEQERIIGRSKGTGLLLGTLTQEQDKKLASEMHSDNPFIKARAMSKWKILFNKQRDPDKNFYDIKQRQYRNIQLECPIWSHVRRTNPRQFAGVARSLIYRRGYLFVETGGSGILNSGLLFICFQKNIENSFEHIKKEFLNNKNLNLDQKGDLPSDSSSIKFQNASIISNKQMKEEGKPFFGYSKTSVNTRHNDQSSGLLPNRFDQSNKIGYSDGQIPGTITLGGGYYFIPPIPNRQISEISEQFFYSD